VSAAGNLKLPALDPEGYLVNLNDWSESLAEQLAAQDGIQLTLAHWEILRLLRQFYQQFELSPAMRPFSRYLQQELSAEKARSIYLMQLFGASPAKAAARIAGLPKPDNCL